MDTPLSPILASEQAKGCNMTDLSDPPQADSALDAGFAALVGCAWDQARACFEAVLQAGEVPEALEGLGRAAWWLGDVALTFRCRERAYQLYRRQGDQRSAARVAVDLAYDHFSFGGRRTIANGWLRRAERLLAGSEPGAEHAYLALIDGFFALAVDNDCTTALQRASYATQLARALGSIDLEMGAVALEGLAWVSVGNISLGMNRLDESVTAAVSGEITDLDTRCSVCCYMITACEWVRDYERAAEWCRHVEQLSGSQPLSLFFAYCRVHYAGILIWRGAWDEAGALLGPVARDLAATRPGEAGKALVQLAELRWRQGRLDEAEALLAQAEAQPFWQAGIDRTLLIRGLLALELGDAFVAAELMERYLRKLLEQNRPQRAGALEGLVQAYLACGSISQAQQMCAELQVMAANVDTEPLRAAAEYAAGLVAASQGKHEEALLHQENACDGYARCGAPFHSAQARLQMAGSLLALGQRGAAEAQAQEACARFQQLGAAHVLVQAQKLLAGVSARPAPTSGPPAGLAGLSERELAVLSLVAGGRSNQEIADSLVLSVRTVERHLYNIYQKLGYTGKSARASVAAFAVQQGLPVDR